MLIKNKIQTLWVEKFRPQELKDFIGNEDIKNKIQSYIDNNDIPHLLFAGHPGTGKTTAAKMLVNHIECDYLYVNASDENSVDVMRDKIKDFASSVGWKKFKIVILDECDFLSANAMAALRNIMETYSKSCRFILTCNYVEKIIPAIQSRCQIFKMFPPSKKEVAIRMVEILKSENIKFNIEDVAAIVENHYPDIRATIGAINLQVINGKLEVNSILDVNTEYKIKLLEYLMIPDKKEAWKLSRQLLMDAGIKDYSTIYRYLYDNIDKFAKGKSSPIILVLAEYEYRDALVVDKEINFAAALASMLLELHK